MKQVDLLMKIDALYSKCSHGECPLCPDAYSSCPVMEWCRKPCMEIDRNDWQIWLEGRERWSLSRTV